MPPEPKEIKPHPYGIELGRLVTMLKDTKAPTIAQFLIHSFSRVSPARGPADLRRRPRSARGRTRRRSAATRPTLLYQAIQQTKIPAPATDCIAPIGEELILKGLHQVVPGEFYAAATRPPAVYRGNPFQIEVGLAYGGTSTANSVPREALVELLDESDARTLRQFLIDHVSTAWAPRRPTRSSTEAEHAARASRPASSRRPRSTKLHEAMQSVNLERRPDDERAALCQPRAAAIPGRRPAPSRRR